MRTEPSTEKLPPCCHCAIACASSPGSRPRRTSTRNKQPPAHARLHIGDGWLIEPGGGVEDNPARIGGVEHAVDDDAVKV